MFRTMTRKAGAAPDRATAALYRLAGSLGLLIALAPVLAPLPAQAAGAFQTCLYSERDFAGKETCYAPTRIRRLPDIGPVGSLRPGHGNYVYLCSQRFFRGTCKGYSGPLGKRFLIPRVRHGSMILVPDRAARVELRNLVLNLKPGRYWQLDATPAAQARAAPGLDMVIARTDAGPVLRPIGGASLFAGIDQWPPSESRGLRAQSCIAQALIGRGAEATGLRLDRMRVGQSLCIRTSQGKWAILRVLGLDPAQARLSVGFYRARS